jgi:hypothetical protein
MGCIGGESDVAEVRPANLEQPMALPHCARRQIRADAGAAVIG